MQQSSPSRRIHCWSGYLVGLLLLVACSSGTNTPEPVAGSASPSLVPSISTANSQDVTATPLRTVPAFTMAPTSSATVLARSTPTQTPLAPLEDSRIYSPDGNYYIEAVGTGEGLYRVIDKQLLSQTPVSFDFNYSETAWAPDSRTVASSDFDHVYLWSIDGRPPLEIMLDAAYMITWSPDARRFAAVESNANSTHLVAFVIVTAKGDLTRVGHDSIRDTDLVRNISWLTEDIIEVVSGVGACCGVGLYFNVDTGIQLPSWRTTLDLSQPPSNSPDISWQARDTSYRLWEGEFYASRDYFPHDYAMLNFRTGEYYSLYYGDSQFIEWVGWTPDSKVFYFVSRPTGATKVADEALPYGLIALNPNSRELRVLFEQAVFAILSRDQAAACVLFPARQTSGRLGLDSGIFNIAAQTLENRRHFSDEIEYPLPATEWFPSVWTERAQKACGW
jgi:hypothetical protein